MKIAIVGAGNMGLALTAYLASKNQYEIVLYTQKKILEKGDLKLNDREKGEIVTTRAFSVSSNTKEVFEGANIVLCTYPAFLRKEFVAKIEPYLSKGVKVGFVPGYGGIEFCCKKLIKKGVVIFALQRVPYVARASMTEKGMEAGILSKKNRLYAAAIPYNETNSVADLIGNLLNIPCNSLKEYLAITLAPSNPLLHITGLYNIFNDYEPEKKFKRRLKFYEEWNDSASELLFKYDDELQHICSKLKPLNLDEVVPLPIYYESSFPQDMTLKLKSIESFKAVMVPLKEVNNGFIADFSSRMFVEDFPFGVCVIKDFARIAGVDTPIVDMLLKFYEEKTGHKYFNNDGSYTDEIKNTGIPGLYGIDNIEDLINYYH